MRHPSPLRYPGGKAILADFLGKAICLNDLYGCPYFEPYAGGAGAALRLLMNGFVSEVYLNDADIRIYAFWKSVLSRTDEFVDLIASASMTIGEWKQQRKICANPNGYSLLKVGFSAFYMNRCNRSGVLVGSGPIGGYEQNGEWRMDVRFYRDALIDRVLKIGEHREYIHVFNQDAINFLRENLPRGNRRKYAFAYLDPPYVDNGKRLYFNAYESKDHKVLARYMKRQGNLSWVISYDDNELIRSLYSWCRVGLFSTKYSLQCKRLAFELIISQVKVELPMKIHPDDKSHLEQIIWLNGDSRRNEC